MLHSQNNFRKGFNKSEKKHYLDKISQREFRYNFRTIVGGVGVSLIVAFI